MTESGIRLNIKAHNRIAEKYESRHTQIFNAVEQERVKEHLALALSLIQSPARAEKALDFGCGSGNITGHLLEAGLSVTAVDVAQAFLRLVERKFPRPHALRTLRINGKDLANIGSDTFDLSVTYSVLHHVPEYLRIVEELVRVTKPGGIVMIDREAAPSYWARPPIFREFQEALHPGPTKLPWTRFFKVETYLNRWRTLRNPRYQPEGDIHVWEDDHIEWDRIKAVLSRLGCDVLVEKEYLSFDSRYPREVYEKYRDLCADDMLVLARKRGRPA